jgi:hypothetical protein
MIERSWGTERSAVRSRRIALLLALMAWLGVACVEREQLPPNPKPLSERFDVIDIQKSERNFAGHQLELGGVATCSDDGALEQTTEIYLRVTQAQTENPKNTSQLSIRITYESGVFKNVQTRAVEEKTSLLEMTEHIQSRLNGDNEICSCVRVNGFASIIGRTVSVATRVCPESKKPKEQPLIRVLPSAVAPREPQESL